MAVYPTFALEMELAGVGGGWTAVTDDVRAAIPVRWRYGIDGSSLTDRVAGPGSLTFALDNSTNNSGGLLGYYAPGHANCRSGFALGINVRLKLIYAATTYYKFFGRLGHIQPAPGQHLERTTLCAVFDWMDEAARAKLKRVAIQIDQRADEILTTLVDAMPRQPVSRTFGTGLETYPYALDGSPEEVRGILNECQKIALSEVGNIYVRGNGDSYATAVINDGPQAYYRLGESSGATAEDAAAGNAHDGTYAGTFTLGITGAVSDGDTAVSLGTNSTVTVPYFANLNKTTGISFEFWAQARGAGTINVITRGGASAPFPYLIGFRPYFSVNRRLTLLTRSTNAGGEDSIYQGGTTIADNTWYHCVVTITGTTIAMYLNGVAETMTTGIGGTFYALNLTDLIIGYAGNAADLYLDEVAFYPVVLTAAQVAAHYALTSVLRGGGGELVFESRTDRATKNTNLSTFDNTMRGLGASISRDDIISRLQVVTHPKRKDTSDQVLFTLRDTTVSTDSTISIGAGETKDTLVCPYTDPADRNHRIGGTSMVNPVATTDYLLNASADGSGTDLTANLSVSVTFAANAAFVSLTNTGGASGFVTFLQLRGRGIYDEQDVISEATSSTAEDDFGEQAITYDMPYQSDPDVGAGASRYFLALLESQAVNLDAPMVFAANSSSTLMTQALVREPGDRIGLAEAATGLTTTTGFFIQSCEGELAEGGILTMGWGLAPASYQAFWLLGNTGSSELGSATLLGF